MSNVETAHRDFDVMPAGAKRLMTLAVLLILVPLALVAAQLIARSPTASNDSEAIHFKVQRGNLFVPVLINGKIGPLDFVVDTGASDVTIPADVVLTLIRTGTLQNRMGQPCHRRLFLFAH